MALIIEHTLIIDAPLAIAWQVLVDLERYREWNPLVVDCQSSLQPGDPIHMRVVLGTAQPRAQKETVFKQVPQHYLSYGITIPFGLFKTYRAQEFEALDNQHTRYQSKLHVQGLLAPIVALSMGNDLRRGFEGMSNALKARAESMKY